MRSKKASRHSLCASEVLLRGPAAKVPHTSPVRLGGHPAAGDRFAQRGVVAFILFDVGLGKPSERDVGGVALTEVAGDGDAVAGAGMGSGGDDAVPHPVFLEAGDERRDDARRVRAGEDTFSFRRNTGCRKQIGPLWQHADRLEMTERLVDKGPRTGFGW